MQTSILENLDALSPKCRQALQAQIKRVQMEAKHLRKQMNELRKAQHAKKDEQRYLLEAERAEKKERKLLQEAAQAQKREHQPMLEQLAITGQGLKQGALKRREQLAATGKGWQQEALKRREQLAATGKGWQQEALKRRKQLAATGKGLKGALKRGRQLKQLTAAEATLAKTSAQLGRGLKRGKNLPQQIKSQAMRSGPLLIQQSKQTGQNIADWKDDLTYILLKQGQNFFNRLMDRREDMTHTLLKQSRKLGRDIADRTEDVAWQLHKQRHQLERTLSLQKEDTTRKLLKQSKKLNRHMKEHRTLWSSLGFVTGLLVAGGATYWFMKRMLQHGHGEEEEGREFQPQQSWQEVGSNAHDEMRYPSKGGTAVATRRSVRAEPTSMFVGVLSTQRYYPIERRPKASEQDLVFFRSEEDARAEGFTPAR